MENKEYDSESWRRGDPRSQPPGSAGWVQGLQRERRPGPGLGPAVWPGAGPSTIAIHAGSRDDERTGAVGTPIYQCTTFLLGEEQYQAIEEGRARDRFIYSRYGNPNQWAVQEKLAALEGAESALVFSSGMAAIAAAVLGLCDRGAHIVASADLYGGTYSLLQQELPSLGMSVTLVDPRELAAVEAAITPRTQLLFFEALSNPLLKVLDVPGVVALARRYQLRLVVDATFLTPLGLKPLEHGADLVVHSASKYLNGHSDVIAGVAAGPRKLVDQLWPRLLHLGGCLDPHACFLLERGLKTLPLRMAAHQERALAVASALQAHPQVTQVLYPGLSSHPDHALARRLLRCTGGVVSFAIQGGDAAALKLIAALRLPRQATSLGGLESLVSLPFNTSHAAMTAAQRSRLGIRPGCVRLSVGLEDPADLIRDLHQALAQAAT